MSIPNIKTTNPKLVAIEKARRVLRGEKNLNRRQLGDLCKELERLDQFAYATEVLLAKMKLDEAAGEKISLAEYQQLAGYIYKDHSLPSSVKFEKALLELRSNDDVFNTDNIESIGLAAAIYKRKWQFDHQFKNLILSQYYYQKGFALWKQFLAAGADEQRQYQHWNDDGYTAINYAYINELMSVDKLEEYGRITGMINNMTDLFAEAASTRRYILSQFIIDIAAPQPVFKAANYASWVYCTVAEAYFGLRNYTAANEFIRQYLQLEGLSRWEIRTFTQQLFSIAYLQLYQKKFGLKEEAGNLSDEIKLQEMLGKIDEAAISNCLQLFAVKEPGKPANPEIRKAGKTGLALSGGGFRASIFHIGVLAALADKDELRSIEVISCVSGGSIIGAYYYLKLKILLESKTDEEIEKADYINLVKEIETAFLKGVQKNLRVHIFSHPLRNFKMIFDQHYSRTHRLGELYEEHLFKEIWEQAPDSKLAEKVKENGGKIYMTDLFIQPKLNAGESFSFSNDNWKRRNRIPQLVLNATSVNTGHNWQFTASWMGEPPGNILADVDVKPRLRRMYYDEAPERYKKFRLGYAVGASSCVPVMFHPMPLHDLYPEIDLQLIDGGLHDNQGIAALIDQECKNMIISDASGQMPTNTGVTESSAAIFYRADTILQERLRELQFLDIKERSSTTQINMLLTVHLKNDLQQNPISWKYCTDPPRTVLYPDIANSNNDLTKYGVLRSVQSKLSEIRTDLDSFNDVEAYALMYSAYRQVNYEMCQLNNEDHLQSDTDWNFLQIGECLTMPNRAEEIEKPLLAAKKIAFKVFDVSTGMRVAAIIAGILAIAVLIYLAVIYWNTSLFDITVAWLAGLLIIFFIGFISKHLAMLLSFKTTFRKYIGLLLLSVVGCMLSNAYLWLMNPLYNKAGRLAGDKNKK